MTFSLVASYKLNNTKQIDFLNGIKYIDYSIIFPAYKKMCKEDWDSTDSTDNEEDDFFEDILSLSEAMSYGLVDCLKERTIKKLLLSIKNLMLIDWITKILDYEEAILFYW